MEEKRPEGVRGLRYRRPCRCRDDPVNGIPSVSPLEQPHAVQLERQRPARGRHGRSPAADDPPRSGRELRWERSTAAPGNNPGARGRRESRRERSDHSPLHELHQRAGSPPQVGESAAAGDLGRPTLVLEVNRQLRENRPDDTVSEQPGRPNHRRGRGSRHTRFVSWSLRSVARQWPPWMVPTTREVPVGPHYRNRNSPSLRFRLASRIRTRA
jgi:hypothetical protein